jgi:hypothetical protein
VDPEDPLAMEKAEDREADLFLDLLSKFAAGCAVKLKET